MQWTNKTDKPLSSKEKAVLDAVRGGIASYQDISEVTGIRLGHCNNILTKLKNRGLVEKVWRRKDVVEIPVETRLDAVFFSSILQLGIYEAIVPQRWRDMVNILLGRLHPQYVPLRYIKHGLWCEACKSLVTEEGSCKCVVGPGPRVRCTIHVIPDIVRVSE